MAEPLLWIHVAHQKDQMQSAELYGNHQFYDYYIETRFVLHKEHPSINFNSHRIAFISFLWPAYSPWPALFWAASAYCLSLPFYKTQKAGRFIAASGPKFFIGCGWGKPAQPVYRVTFLGSTNGTTCATASCRVRGDWLLSRSISLYLRLPMPSSCM